MLGISPGRSDFLNSVRWLSACVVLLGHAAMTSRMLAGERDEGALYAYLSSHAHIAVMFFFVLSGYLIGYSVHGRRERSADYGFRDYFLDRWSRIYSVLVPAIALTLLLDGLGAAHSANYAAPAHFPQDAFWVRLGVNLVSLQGLQGHRVQLGSNPALWSIGYEFCYYMVFGLICFRSRLFARRWTFPACLLAIALLAGWHMSAYFLIWLTGYAAFRLHHLRGIAIHPAWGALLGLLIVAANHYLAYLDVFALPEFLSDAAIALLFGGMLLCRFPRRASPAARFNAWMADFSYSIYAYHMPIMFFWYSMLPMAFHLGLDAAAEGVLLMAACIAAARLLYLGSEARRAVIRKWAAGLLAWRSSRPRPRAV